MTDYRNHAWRHHPTKGTDPVDLTEILQTIPVTRYIVGNYSDSDWHTFEQAATPGGIDGTGDDQPTFDTWVSNDDGSVFANDGAGGYGGSETSALVRLKQIGLYAMFANTKWKAPSSGTSTPNSCGIVCSLGGGVTEISQHPNDTRRYWNNFALGNVTDQFAYSFDFNVWDMLLAWVPTADYFDAGVTLRIEADTSGTIEDPTRDFKDPQIGIVYIGLVA